MMFVLAMLKKVLISVFGTSAEGGVPGKAMLPFSILPVSSSVWETVVAHTGA